MVHNANNSVHFSLTFYDGHFVQCHFHFAAMKIVFLQESSIVYRKYYVYNILFEWLSNFSVKHDRTFCTAKNIMFLRL